MSDKVRIHEIAKELGIDSREVVQKAKEVGINVASASSSISMVQAEKIANFIINGLSIGNFYNTSIPTSKTINTIKIVINNLKSIVNLEWSFVFEPGIHVLIAENGSGKSSLIVSLAKLIQPNIYALEFIGKGYDKSLVNFTINNSSFSWAKTPIWQQVDKESTMPRLNGFFESSILSGSRFKSINQVQKEIEVDEKIDQIIPADEFIQNNMNYILFGDKDNSRKFVNLYHVSVIRNRKFGKKFKKRKYSFYALKNDLFYIKEYFLSTGEYFLLLLLKSILTIKNSTSKVTNLIIIDEIELSLHPLAQKRLMERISEFYKDYNLLFIFATHSLQVIDNIEPEHIHYLENNQGECSMTSPIYPGYLTSKLYVHSSYDFILLVEDDLAKRFIEQTIRNNIDEYRMSFTIIPIGGWEKIYEIHQLNLQKKLYGSAKTLIVFDGDVKTIPSANKRHYRRIPREYLPLENIETTVVYYLKDKDIDFLNFIQSYVMAVPFDDFDVQIEYQNTEQIKNTYKKFIKEFSKYMSSSEDAATDKIITQIIKQHAAEENFINFETNICAFLELTND